ncbi:uncharacterized protein LOC118182650 isoform X2 [Stegodyphus dumicola]|uniref:uncharacterized protein LOC118182650 isoform X2 n=1 Tax=Stegodyphus dumicola TaxID=202533 RepID=UPI0015B14D9F|nr:uncharacterized protein LOC118182650 isoform X2 [Stegodyphus dumicola]
MQKYSKLKSKQGIISKFRKSATILTSKFGRYKLTQDAADLIAVILYEVNKKLIDSCISNSGKGEVSPKNVVQVIKTLLSKEMSRCALATANLKIVSHQSGKLGHKVMSEQKTKGAAVKPEIFKKGLIQLATLAHRHYSLSPDVRTIMSIIYKLVAKLSLKAVTEIGEKSEMELKDVVSTVRAFLPSDLYSHADSHASENVSRYENDLLDFKIKPFSEEHLSDTPKQSDVLRPGLKNLAHQLQVSFGKDTLGRLEDLLWSACDGLAEKASEIAKQEKAKTLSMIHLYNAMKTAFPSRLFHQSCANAEASILNYQCGLLNYEPPTLLSRAEVTTEPDLKVVTALNFKNTIRSITQDCQRRLLFGIGCLALLNDILNEIVGSLAEKCIEEANKKQTGHMSENEALGAINSIFPEEMKRHAFARLLDVHREVSLPLPVTSEKLILSV